MVSFAIRSISLAMLGGLVVAVAVCAQETAEPAFPASTETVAATSRVFAETETIAIVGDQHILAGDLLGDINQMLAPYAGKVPEEELNQQRQVLLQQMLPTVVDNKILYLEFLRQIPKDKLETVKEKIYAEFDEEKIEPAMARAKVNTPAELDRMMRKYGMSLDKERRKYMEQKLGRAMMSREIDYKPEITHDEMIAYYAEHTSEFDVQARAIWEQFTVRYANHQTAEDPTGKLGAWAKIASMGNEVLRNAKFDAVAKKHSEGSNSESGGLSDWVTKGSLASEVVDDAVFTLPINQLSQIIADDRGFHIIRVRDREDASRISFLDAQEDIREKLKEQKIKKQVEDYIAKMKARTSVWTVFDPPATPHEVARQPQASGGYQLPPR